MFQGEHPQSHDDQLDGDERHQSTERLIHKAVGVQTYAEHVHSEPGQTDHDVDKNTHHSKSTFANEDTPTGVKNDSVPQDDKKRSVLLRVPSPESPPRLIGTNSAEDGSHEAEQGRKASDAVDHSTE